MNVYHKIRAGDNFEKVIRLRRFLYDFLHSEREKKHHSLYCFAAFMENKKMFVGNEEKIIFDAIGFPIAGSFAIMLLFDDELF